jgi:pimeloyl-ACP methyl ester carboxylesterase
MRTALISLIRSLFTVVLFVSAANAETIPASGGGNPRHISPTWAALHTRYYAPYALQAAAAYGAVARFEAAHRRGRSGVGTALDVAEVPEELRGRARSLLRGWRYQFGSEAYLKCMDSDPDCLKEIRADRWTLALSKGPAFHVWAHMRSSQTESDSCSEVSIAFRGTTGSSADWVSNFHQVGRIAYDDYYRQLRRNVGPIMKRIAALPCYGQADSKPQIVSVGHSLGAGLAQMHALAHPTYRPDLPRIAKVFAFDPSPVTGADLVDHRTLMQNAKGLEIDRVYQNGEVLSYLRKLTQQYPKSSSPCDPIVRTVEFGLFQEAGATALHSINGFARELTALADKYQVPQSAKDCSTRYRAPTIDEHERDLPPAEVVARAGGRRAGEVLASDNRIRRINSFAQSNGVGTGFLVSTKMAGATRKGAGMASARDARAIAKRQVPAAMHFGNNGAPLRGGSSRQAQHETPAQIRLAITS